MGDNNAKVMQLRERAFEGRVGEFLVEVRNDGDGGSLVLTPAAGAPLVLTIKGDTLEMRYAGPEVRFVAPDASMRFEAKNVAITAQDTVAIHAGREIDLHSAEDVEVRADHQVNLWAHGVIVGD